MVRYAIIGTSWITETFIGGAMLVPGMQLAAVYSRSAEKGRSFADKFTAAGDGGQIPVYTDLLEMAQSDIDGGLIGGAALKAEDFLAIGKGF